MYYTLPPPPFLCSSILPFIAFLVILHIFAIVLSYRIFLEYEECPITGSLKIGGDRLITNSQWVPNSTTHERLRFSVLMLIISPLM
jgi:hypothetical protein